MLAQCLPYPPHSGVANRTFNVLRQLAVEFDIDLVPFSRINHQPDRAARAAAREALRRMIAYVGEPTPIPNELSKYRKLWDHLRSLATGRAYTYYEYDSDEFRDRLHQVTRTRGYDLVHLDSLDLHRWLSELPTVPIACTHHNLESELLRRYALGLRPAPIRQYVLMQVRRLEALEREITPRLSLNVMVSEADARGLRELAPRAVTKVIPNGTDVGYFQPHSGSHVPGRVAFIGPTYSFPNRDAVEYLLQDIWPEIRAGASNATLQLIGRHSPADHARYAAVPAVQPLGHIPDIRPPVGEAECCVVPIRIGGGTRLKILDAWAMGKAIVSTSIGCEGLEARDGENILIRDTAEGFAAAVVQVLRDPELRARLEQSARRTALETYAWDVVGRKLRAAYNELAGRPSASARMATGSIVSAASA
jgi:glycosyltransferase involved in cell wall biosynthesis